MSPSAVPQSAQTGAASASGGVIAGRTRAFLGGRSTGCSSPGPSSRTAHGPGWLTGTAELPERRGPVQNARHRPQAPVEQSIAVRLPRSIPALCPPP